MNKPVNNRDKADEKKTQRMREKYADMYLTMICLLTEDEISAGQTPTRVPQKSESLNEPEYRI